jgi:hypothetical protein
VSRRGILLVSIIAIAALAVAWWSTRQPATTPRTANQLPSRDVAPNDPVKSDPNPVARPQATAAPQPPAVLSPADLAIDAMRRELPGFNVPFGEAVAKLRELDKAGNTSAQIELSRRLSRCTAPALREAAAMDESDRRSLEEDAQNTEMSADWRETRALNSQIRMDAHAAERAACASFPAELLSTWLDPIDRAAKSGRISAMREYASLALAEYDSVDAIVADIDTVIARRDKARGYLQEVIRLGDAEGLADLALEYLDGRKETPHLYAIDSFRAYVYAYAGSLAGLSRVGWIMSDSSDNLSPGQIEAARAEGQRVYQMCCQGH